MKKIVVIIIGICISTAGFAQFTVGPKIGISSSNIKIDEVESIKSGDSKVGFHVGLFSRITLGSFYLQPEATFTSAGGEIEISDDNGDTFDQIAELNYNKLDVPLMAGLKFGNIFRINAGPVFSLILSEDARNVDNTVDEVKSNYNNALVGYQAGAGIDLGNLTVDLRYEGNLSKLGESIQVGNESFNTDMRNNQILLSVGFKLL